MTIKQAVEKIRNAWIAGLISGFITLIFTLMTATSDSGGDGGVTQGATAWYLLDVLLVFLFTFGIYMKSRVAAIGMCIYFLASKVMMITSGTVLTGMLSGIVFLYFYFEGARGAIAYHRLQQTYNPSNLPTASPETPVASPENR